MSGGNGKVGSRPAGKRQPATEEAMDALAGGADRTGRSVRGVARWSHNTGCGMANAMYAARVDSDKLLKDTVYEAEFGQSPFAIARGARVEAIGRRDNYKVTFDLLKEHFGFAVPEVVPLDMRHGYAKNNQGMQKRADATREALERILRHEPGAPNVIDGAVLAATIGGYAGYLEADGVGAKAGPVLNINEFKGWPVVDGRADDAGKLGETQRQMGIYRWLLMDLIDRLGHDTAIASSTGLLVTPKNVGLTLVGTPVSLERATTVAETTLKALPDPVDYVDAVAPEAGFGAVADIKADSDSRLDRLDGLADTFGTHYQESCLSSCGLAKFCRSRAHDAGEPSLCGMATVRFLPGVRSLDRAADLADGAPPETDEIATGAADILGAAGDLYRAKKGAVA